MTKLIVKQARPGMVVQRTVPHPLENDQILLARGTVLTAKSIARLHELGVYEIWVEDLAPPSSIDADPQWTDLLQHATASITQWIDPTLSKVQRDEAINEVAAATKTALSRAPLRSLLNSAPDPLKQHGIEVACLALLLGLRLNAYLIEQRKRLPGTRAKDVANLGLGCLLHDIGETRLAENERESKAAESGPDGHWKKHAEIGFELTRLHLEPSAATVVLHHHQHFDGTGFPAAPGQKEGEAIDGQRESQIHVFARVAAVADMFCHFLRYDGVPMPVVYALWKFHQRPWKSWFDPIIVRALFEVIPPFVPGMVVTLSDGQKAVVVRHNPETPCFPLVQIIPGDLHQNPRAAMDLAASASLDLQHTDLTIQYVDGVDVSPYLYGKRGTEKEHAVVRQLLAI